MIYKKYTEEDKNVVKDLFLKGMNKCQISKITKINRRTLAYWLDPRNKKRKKRNSYVPIEDFSLFFDSEEKISAYSFILATYLCDGCISTYKTVRAPSIRLFNDSRYVKNIQEWAEKLKILFPKNVVNVIKQKHSNCFVILTYNKNLIELFPQHGKGVKYKRKLILTDWQKEIIEKYPKEFVKGCFQSDGCIYTQKVGKYEYRKHSFSNKSEDIIDFLLYALRLIGIEKEKYRRPDGIFVIQNFKKDQQKVLNEIIFTKE